MDDLTGNSRQTRIRARAFAAGCLVILYLVLCSIAGLIGRNELANRNAPTPTPTDIPVPHVLVHAPIDQSKVIYENFSSNHSDWELYYDGKIEVIQGKLVLQSVRPNIFSIGTSRQLSTSSETYYIQADFLTDIDTAAAYGMVFGLNRSLGTYYLFELFPNTGFRLFKANAGQWTELVPYTRAKMRRYPNANTLSVYFDKGVIELYINGELVSEYTDQEFLHSKDFGVYVDNSGYRLLVDDLFIVDAE
jgi:hypothetical protein